MFQELGKLFGNPRRAKLLKFFLFQPEVKAPAAAAGAAIGIPKAEAEKDARFLAREGFLIVRKQKKNTFYAANQSHALYRALRAFFDATTLPSDKQVLSAFKGVPGISLLVATGSLAHEERSSVDLLVVVRKPGNPKIGRAVSRLERFSGLPIRYAVMEPERYAERLEAHDRLLRDVFEFENRIILGRP